MSGIFGLFRRDGSIVAPGEIEAMRGAMSSWGLDGGGVWRGGCAGLGQARTFATPESPFERLPNADLGGGCVFTAAGRVDNRRELMSDLKSMIEAWPAGNVKGGTAISDGDLMFHAYRRWGEDGVHRIYGDWALAAYHPAERKLFLARDHYGNTSLYYYVDARVFAFASDPAALLALDPAPMAIDELYLAQMLVSWFAYHGERTIRIPIKRLPPAHALTVTPGQFRVRQYWFLEDTPESGLKHREDYVAALRDVFDEAVRARLRVFKAGSAEDSHELGVTLSGGLDSGAVTVTAAGILRGENRRLAAFTSVPLYETHAGVDGRFSDEWPFAQTTARMAGNVDLHAVPASSLTPIQAVRRVLRVYNEPVHAAGNYYWILELTEAARKRGCRALLTGQMGNSSISWAGDVLSQPLMFQISRLGWRSWAKEVLKRHAPAAVLNAYRHRRRTRDEWWKSSAIRPDFALRLRLLERWLSDPDWQSPRSPRAQRLQMLLPGRTHVGALHAQLGASYGLEVRDPSADARVLAFTLSVPDRLFMDAETGLDRWLIRAAMKGRLPDPVRLNRQQGRQAGDLAARLRASAVEVEAALGQLSGGAAAEYVDVPYLRQVWGMIQKKDTPEAYRKSVAVLTRGIMAGLFVNQWAAGRPLGSRAAPFSAGGSGGGALSRLRRHVQHD